MREKCLTCKHDPKDHLVEGVDANLYKQRKLDHKMVKDYCKDHEQSFRNHKMKPIWRKCCGILDQYQITLKDPKAGFPSYMK